MEGCKIEKVADFGGNYKALFLDNGKVVFVGIYVEDLLKALDLKAFPKEKLAGLKEEAEPEKEREPEREPESDEEGDAYTWSDLLELDYKSLKELCEEYDLGTDPADYAEEEVDVFRKEIAEEIGVEIPEENGAEDEPSPDKEKEGDDDDDEYTWDDLKEMDYDELTDLCDEGELDVDPNDFGEDEEDKLRRAIAEEIGITPPKRPPKKK